MKIKTETSLSNPRFDTYDFHNGSPLKVARFLLLIFSFFFLPLFSYSQQLDSSYQVVFQQKNVAYFTVDPLQNLYVVFNKGLLSKYDPNGKQLFTYENTVSGQLASIDASDPFNILLFFPDQQSILVLDRTLSERSTLDFRNTTVQQASAIALSHDNNIWTYDDFESRLLKIDADGRVLLRSENLLLSKNINEKASHIFRWQDKVLVNFPNHGIAVFNLFADFEKRWPITGITDAQARKNGLSYNTPDGYFNYLVRPNIIQKVETKRFQNCLMVRNIFRRQYLLDTSGNLSVWETIK